MANFVSKTGVWNIEAGQQNTPTLHLTGLDTNQVIKLTCQFSARTMTDDLGDGFEYSIENSGGASSLTPARGIVQGSDSWQLYTHVALFEVQSGGKVDFSLITDTGSMNGKGAMMNFLLLAEMA